MLKIVMQEARGPLWLRINLPLAHLEASLEQRVGLLKLRSIIPLTWSPLALEWAEVTIIYATYIRTYIHTDPGLVSPSGGHYVVLQQGPFFPGNFFLSHYKGQKIILTKKAGSRGPMIAFLLCLVGGEIFFHIHAAFLLYPHTVQAELGFIFFRTEL